MLWRHRNYRIIIIIKGFWLEKPERWNVGGSDLVGDLHTLDFRLYHCHFHHLLLRQKP